MSKTHLAVGVASAMYVAATTTTGGSGAMLPALMGGALGSVAPDIDILDNDYESDALIGQAIAVGSVALSLGIGQLAGLGILSEITADQSVAIAGLVIYGVLCVIGFFQPHRGFTHSLLAMVLFTIAVALVYTPAAIYFMVAFVSHIAIDLLNKRGVQILFPLKFRPCLGIFYADSAASTVLMCVGLAASVVLIVKVLMM